MSRVATPFIDVEDSDSPELTGPEATKYRAIVARANFLAQDRSDIRFAVKELFRNMSNPKQRNISELKRLARYLVARPRMVCKFERQKMPKKIVGWSDSD